ncbi:MAG: hypothetical protein JSV91_04815 [Phycisphaerales bacterium]|nr:MAG: hypothetical protein JSV91_04815 [Phycisphaerales bacterium]
MTFDRNNMFVTRLIALLAMLSICVLPACTAGRPVLEPCDESLMDLAFLTGVWVTDSNDGLRTEEIWSTPDAGTMLGVSRTISIGEDDSKRETVFFEFLRIEHTAEDDIIYHASPEGRPPTSFRLIERSHTRFVFENPEHDFPQRIIYEQQDDASLLTRIEGVEDGEEQSSEWRLRRARIRSGLTEYEIRQRRISDYWWHRRFYYDHLFYHRYYDDY